MLILFIRSPWGQGIVVQKAVSYVKGKTGTELSIGRLYITFGGNIFLEDLYIEDSKGDTLLYSQKLTTGVDFIPLLSGDFAISRLEWENATAKIKREEKTGAFNFDFLTEAFSSTTEESNSLDQVEPDTTSTPFSIKLGPISIRNIDAIYSDEVLGIDASFNVGSLEAKIPGIDLDSYEFEISQFALENVQAFYRQTKPFAASEADSTASLMPNVKLKNVSLKNVALNYISEPDEMIANIDLGEFKADLPEANLQQQIIRLAALSIEDSKILYHSFAVSAPEIEAQSHVESVDFEWSDWDVKVDDINISNTDISYKTKDVSIRKGVFNPEAIQLTGLTVDLENFFLQNEKVGADLNEFSFNEGSGFALQKLSTALRLDNKGAKLEDILLQTNRSSLDGNLSISYPSISSLINNPESATVNLVVKELRADVRDGFYFSPELAQDTLMRELAKSPLILSAAAKGDLSQINISRMHLRWDETNLRAVGSLSNPMDMEKLTFNFSKITGISSRNNIIKFIDEQALGIQIPEKLELTSTVSGSLEHVQTDTQLLTDLGNITLKGNFQNANQIAFDVDLAMSTLLLGKLIKNEQLDTLSFTLNAKGAGSSLNTLNAEINSTFSQLGLYGHNYSGLNFGGKLVNGKGDLTMALTEKDLDFDLITQIELDSIHSIIDLNLNLRGADFYALGFTEKPTRSKLIFNANFEGDLEEFDIQTELKEGMLVFDGSPYMLGNLDMNGSVRNDSTSLDISSKILNGYVRTNTNPEQLISALTQHFRQFLDKSDSNHTASRGDIVMNMDLSITNDILLSQVLLKGLEQFDSASIKANYYEASDSLLATVDFPYINYSGTEIDSLGLRVRSNREDLRMYFGYRKLTTGPVNMDLTYLTGQLADSRMYFDFHSYQGEEKTYHLSSDLGINGDTLSYHVSSIDLLLKGEQWNVPENNLVKYSGNSLEFTDFNFSKGNQHVNIVNNKEGFSEENIALVFNGFRLSTLTSLFNPKEIIAGGKLNGQLVVENPFGATGLLGELKIDSLKALNVPLGNLSLDAAAQSLGEYLIDLQLKDGGIDLDLGASLTAAETGGVFDIDLFLNRVEMEKLAELSQGELLNASGYLMGNIQAKGTSTDPRYTGEFQFKEASFVPAQLSTRYILSDEEVRIDNEGIYFNSFTFSDEDNNTFDINGTVGTESFINPAFDLKLTAENFMAVNSTDQDNELIYGKAVIDADVSVKGDLNLPVVNARLKVKNNTNLTVIVPESELDIIEREGIVVFVNRSDPNDILTRSSDQSSSSFVGYDIRAILDVEPKALFTIVIDPQSGDNLAISGTADLSMDIEPNGRITLSGSYEIEDGHYEMSMYNLVNREFDIAKGSRITWNGDPLDASMDIRAIYTVEAGSSELMSAQLTGSNEQSTSQFQEKLPFEVYLNVGGELLRPEISFRLDMPENERGAFGGAVYSRVLQINDQEDELNKQVFSLLVLNRFFPSTGSDGSRGGAEAIARNSLSQIFSDQLNNLSGKLFGNSGLSLGFDVDSYNQGDGKARTELNINAQQKLFDDRLIVQVGSNVDVEGSSQSEAEGSSILANISFEYLLTDDGRWRIRAFRKNQFESIIDGQLVVTGAGLIFNREFNEFSGIWKPKDENLKKENPIDKLLKEKEEKKEQKKIEKRKEEEEEITSQAAKNSNENEN